MKSRFWEQVSFGLTNNEINKKITKYIMKQMFNKRMLKMDVISLTSNVRGFCKRVNRRKGDGRDGEREGRRERETGKINEVMGGASMIPFTVLIFRCSLVWGIGIPITGIKVHSRPANTPRRVIGGRMFDRR